MVRVATRRASTSPSPTQHRLTARTILLTSTGSLEPFRFLTRIEVWGRTSSALRGTTGSEWDCGTAIDEVSFSIRCAPSTKLDAHGRGGRADALVGADPDDGSSDRPTPPRAC